MCQRDREAFGTDLGPFEEPLDKWKTGTWHGGKFDVDSNVWSLARRRVPLRVLKDKVDVYIAG